jgi:hypothetical protein
MKVSTVLAALQQEDPNSEIMVQWFTKEDVESNTGEEYTNEHWDVAVSMFDSWDTGMDVFEIVTSLNEAGERLASLGLQYPSSS